MTNGGGGRERDADSELDTDPDRDSGPGEEERMPDPMSALGEKDDREQSEPGLQGSGES